MKVYKYITLACVFLSMLLCAAIVAVMLRSHQPAPMQPQAAVKAEPKITILVASRQLLPGEILKSEDLEDRKVPQSFRSFGTLLSDQRKNFIGTLLKVTIPKGAQLRADDVVHPGTGGFLAALLAPGMRGVSIPVDPSSAVSGLIWPGDYVDVVLVPANAGSAGAEDFSAASRTIFQNVHVVAIDQTVVRGRNPTQPNQTARTAVLELSPENARKLVLAQKMGRVVLTLRPLMHPDEVAVGPDVTWNEEIFDADGSDGASHHSQKKSAKDQDDPKKSVLRVFNGLTEVTGAH